MPETVDPAMVDPAMIEAVPVTFAGEGSGTDALSWGQSDIWRSMTRYESPMPLGGARPLAPGMSVDDVVAELRYLLNRYQSMRTRVFLDGDGQPQQAVSDAGEITLEVVDVSDDGDPAAVAEATAQRYREQPFDYEHEWPVRMAVTRHRGALTHMAVIMCHLALDGFGAVVMMQEVAARETSPVSGMQPLEQARWQRSPAGQRQSDAALRYAEGILRSMPKPWIGGSGDPRQPRHWEGEFDSTAMALALPQIAARTGTDTAPVLLVAYAIALQQLTGVNPVALNLVVSNRFRPGLATAVGPLSQPSLCLLDIADLPFDQALERATRATMTSYKYAYYDPTTMRELVVRVTRERGPGFDVDYFFNDRRSAGMPAETDEWNRPGSAKEALSLSTFRWTASKDTPSARLFVQADDLSGIVRLNIFADTQHISPANAEALLWQMEAILVDATIEGRDHRG